MVPSVCPKKENNIKKIILNEIYLFILNLFTYMKCLLLVRVHITCEYIRSYIYIYIYICVRARACVYVCVCVCLSVCVCVHARVFVY